ncbi:MAG: sporulation membrane protein YtaF [Firmicutes bacterium HGW-Firmicutes-12]|jgi:putative sporulation protein YtaF|nr:MAG: sporulation membrane protein YtaF [Firmicutes bacterium HGW-Firmicutes-12]
MFIFQTVLFALALSLDGFGVGLSYGMRKITIPKLPFLIICTSSAIAITLSMLIGNTLASIIPYEIACYLGSLLLIIIGTWLLIQNIIINIIPDNRIYKLQIKSLGLIIKILKEPVVADMDSSGSIDVKEALFLGTALAMDALGAGFAAAMAGYSPIFTPLFVAAAKFTLVSLGLFLGRAFTFEKMQNQISLLPGGLIILLGLKNFIYF